MALISLGKGVGARLKLPVLSWSRVSSPAHFTSDLLLLSSSQTEAWKLPESELLSPARSGSGWSHSQKTGNYGQIRSHLLGQ